MPVRAVARPVLRLGAWLVRAALRGYVRLPSPRRPAAPVDARPAVHILLMSAWGMGGTIRSVLGLAGHLAAGHDVELVSVVRRRDRPHFAAPAGVRVTVADDQRPGAQGGLAHAVLHRLPSALMHRADRSATGCSLWTDVRLARLLRRARPGVLIATRPALNLAALELAPRGIAVVGQEHMHLAAHAPALRDAIRRRYTGLAAFVVLTERDRRGYAPLLGERVRLEHIPNAVPPHAGPPSSLTRPRVLAAGRLTPQKGFDMLIPAFAAVAAREPAWTLRICGGGSERAALERLVAEHALEGRVELRGPVSDLPAEMAAASLFVLSSRSEGMPMVLLEAMDKGLPVVSFDCPTGPGDLVEDHANGILVAPGDVAGLGRAMLELIEDAALRRRCAEGALRTARDYAMDRVGPRWDRLLSELGEPGC